MQLNRILNILTGTATVTRSHVNQALAQSFAASPQATDCALRYVLTNLGQPALTKAELTEAKKLIAQYSDAQQALQQHGHQHQRAESLRRRNAAGEAIAAGEIIPPHGQPEAEFAAARRAAMDVIARTSAAAVKLWIGAVERNLPLAEELGRTWADREAEAARSLRVPVGFSTATLTINQVPARLARDMAKLRSRSAHQLNVPALLSQLGVGEECATDPQPVQEQQPRTPAADEIQVEQAKKPSHAERWAEKEKRKAAIHAEYGIKAGGAK